MTSQLDGSLSVIGESPLSLAEILDHVDTYVSRFVAYPSDEAKTAHVLWIAHTHCMGEWDSTPRIAFLSPEPGSGKTRALEITETLTTRPLEAVNATPAYLFRKVSDPDGSPTILFDEIDTVFGPRAKDNEEIRGMLNAGHRRGAMAGRCVTRGSVITTEELPAYCAVAVAGIGDLPDTILSRSIVIRMRRRAANENIEPYRRRLHSISGNALRDRLADWAETFEICGNYPVMPVGVEDRAADVWEALIAIADAAGDGWSHRARVAAVALVAQTRESTPSLGVRLLEDLRKVFGGETQLPTATILQRLNEMDEAPWSDLRGRALDPRRLANFLRPYDVKSKTIREETSTPKGYTAADLKDAWDRYLDSGSDNSATSATTATEQQAEHAEDEWEGERDHLEHMTELLNCVPAPDSKSNFELEHDQGQAMQLVNEYLELDRGP